MSPPSVNIPKQNLTNDELQTYQGIADTAGPYANLYSSLGPLYGQIALGNQQQQLFGYNTGGGPGSIGTPATPPGGFFGGSTGAPAAQQGSKGQPVSGQNVTGQLGSLIGGADTNVPSQPAPSYAGPSGQPANLGGGVAPVPGPYQAGVGTGGAAAAPTTGGLTYSPPNGTLTGLGPSNAFNDPYASQAGPSQLGGYHPGVLDLNATGLSSYGPLGTEGILQSNPFLTDALGAQNQNLFNASNSPILQQLNASAQNELSQGGQLSPEQLRSTTQGTLSNLPAGLLNSPQSTAAQLLGRDQFANSRLLQAQQFAQGVQGLNTQQSGLLGNLASQAAGSATSGITNPLFQLFDFGSLNGTSDPSASINAQNSLFNPFQQLGNQVSDFNANAAANSSIANANSSAAQNSGILSLLGSLGSGLLSGAGAYASDERVKTDIKKTGEKTKEGIPLKSYRYKTDKKKVRRVGVMAQDVEKVNPFLVKTDALSGIKMVNYGALGLNPFQLEKAA